MIRSFIEQQKTTSETQVMSHNPTTIHKASKHTYLGLFVIALATLMFEIHLTRVFSITMWYHFAFLAITMAMFGLTTGALLVYLLPSLFTSEKTKQRLTQSAFFFAISILLSFLAHVSVPFTPSLTFAGFFSVASTCAVVSIPFIFSGICTCLALTSFPNQISGLYAADLSGAAVGCLTLILLLNITDGATAMIVISLLASLGAVFFAGDSREPKLQSRSSFLCGTLAVVAVIHGLLAAINLPPIHFTQVKVGTPPPALYEKWNSFSHVRVFGNPFLPTPPFGWGLSPTYPKERLVSQLWMSIDAAAFTPLTYYRGNIQEVEHLKYDVTNLAHYLRANGKVLVIGIGGGRDILSALAFNQKSVLGIEINEAITNAVMSVFGLYTGYLDKDPRVTIVNDEARSYIGRIKDQYDIIQSSLIDTSAATAAGAYTLTENSLYTVEAWKTFLNHLAPRGILTFSRWYVIDKPGEIYRLTALATEALAELGITNTRNHIIIVANRKPQPTFVDGIGTIMVSKAPFTKEDIATVEKIAHDMKFDVVLSPTQALDPVFAKVASEEEEKVFVRNYPLNIAAPRDDSPYFFNMLRFADMFKYQLWQQGTMSFNLKAVTILGLLLLVISFFTVIAIILPLIIARDISQLKGTTPFLAYFALIGLGFMLIEISQMQRLIIFLGHPVYSLSVVLFTLLLASSLGSLLTRNISSKHLLPFSIVFSLVLVSVLTVFGAITPLAIEYFRSATTTIRIFLAAAILFPLGLALGTAFPMGMRLALEKNASLTPWLWGINGVTSVLASVASAAIALTAGISCAFWAGTACYLASFVCVLTMTNSLKPSREP